MLLTVVSNLVLQQCLTKRWYPTQCPGLDGLRRILGEHPVFLGVVKTPKGEFIVVCPDRFKPENLPYTRAADTALDLTLFLFVLGDLLLWPQLFLLYLVISNLLEAAVAKFEKAAWLVDKLPWWVIAPLWPYTAALKRKKRLSVSLIQISSKSPTPLDSPEKCTPAAEERKEQNG